MQLADALLLLLELEALVPYDTANLLPQDKHKVEDRKTWIKQSVLCNYWLGDKGSYDNNAEHKLIKKFLLKPSSSIPPQTSFSQYP